MTDHGGASVAAKPWYRKWWIWAIVGAVIVVGLISGAVRGGMNRPGFSAAVMRGAALG